MDQIKKWNTSFMAPDPSSCTKVVFQAQLVTCFKKPNIRAPLANPAVKLFISHGIHVILGSSVISSKLLGGRNFTPYPSLDRGSLYDPAVILAFP